MSRMILAALLAGILLAACAGGSTSAAPAVNAYLQAKVGHDDTGAVQAACAAWEAQARAEVASFASMNARLEAVTCADQSNDGRSAVVACIGSIVTVYNGETREWNLADRDFKVVVEGGEWRMCGYE